MPRNRRGSRRIEARERVLEERVTAADVTGAFVASRPGRYNRQGTEPRLLNHLHRTASLADFLLVEKERSRARARAS